MVSKHKTVDFSLSNLQFYTSSAHGAHKSSLPEPHTLHAPNDSTSHAGPISRHAYYARKVLCKISTLHLHCLRHHQSHHFQIQFPSLIHYITLVCLLYDCFGEFFYSKQIFTAGFLTVIRFSYAALQKFILKLIRHKSSS